MSRLITPSLMGSINWYLNCPPSWREKAFKDLKNQLGREYSEPMSPALQLGIKFEDAVYACAQLERDAGSDHFKWFVAQCKGGIFQKRTRQYITIDGQQYCLFGKMDAWFPSVIKDIKTTSNYKGPEHYLASFQHKMYCYNEQITDFVYLIAEFDDTQQLIAHHSITYKAPSHDKLEKEIVDTIEEATEFLKGYPELMTLYTTKFSKY